ncbi:MAG: TCP-1/cpn60 chaperonin family protein, partial [Candidatus Asgardarchaeia archaeon]
MAIAGTPVLILKEGTQRSQGRDARRSNIMAAIAIAESIRTSLGPRGMDKMLVDSLGDVTITNDGRTILDEMEVQHPAAKMMVQVAKAQDQIVGDGTTTSVVLAGELLRKAEELLEQGIHPTIIVNGYQKAANEALRILDDIAMDVNKEDIEALKDIAKTALNSKVVKSESEYLSDIVVKASLKVAEEVDGKDVVDIDRIQIIKKEGGSVRDSELVEGIIVDKEVVHPDMPKSIKDAKIALIQSPL